MNHAYCDADLGVRETTEKQQGDVCGVDTCARLIFTLVAGFGDEMRVISSTCRTLRCAFHFDCYFIASHLSPRTQCYCTRCGDFIDCRVDSHRHCECSWIEYSQASKQVLYAWKPVDDYVFCSACIEICGFCQSPISLASDVLVDFGRASA